MVEMRGKSQKKVNCREKCKMAMVENAESVLA